MVGVWLKNWQVHVHVDPFEGNDFNLHKIVFYNHSLLGVGY